MDNINTKGTEHGNYTYGYDNLYRLINADNPVQNDEAYSYDEVGNRLTSASTTAQWQYNANNELQSYNGTSYQYDANGNTTNQTNGTNSTNYIYNVEDRLVRVEGGTGSLIAEYYYDPFGRRLWKDVAGVQTYFLYADEGLIGEYDFNGTEIKAYGYIPDSTWTTDPLYMKIGSDYYFYHNDHLGTPQKITAINGAVVWKANYSTFGNAEIDITSTITNNLRFPGQYFDQETGLHYNYYRYYDPSIGRYLRSDPITFSRGALNRYVYVDNDPILRFDCNGLITVEWILEPESPLDFGGNNMITVATPEIYSQDGCRFYGKVFPTVITKNRLFWEGEVVEETGPQLIKVRNNNCCGVNDGWMECYIYFIRYRWTHPLGGAIPFLLPPYIIFPDEDEPSKQAKHWIQSSIMLIYCANGESRAVAKSTTNLPKYFKPRTYE